MSSFASDSESESEFASQDESDNEIASQEESDNESLMPYKTELGAPRYNVKFLGDLINHREDLYNILQEDFQLTLPNKVDFLQKLLDCIGKTRQVEEEYQLENACVAIECICDTNKNVASFKSLAEKLDYFSKEEDYKEVEEYVLASLSLTMNDVHVQTYIQDNPAAEGTVTIYIVDDHTSVTEEYIDEIKDVMDELGSYPKESLSMEQVKNFNNYIFLKLIAAEGDCEQFLGYEALKRQFFIH
jgi:hypothetical protein